METLLVIIGFIYEIMEPKIRALPALAWMMAVIFAIALGAQALMVVVGWEVRRRARRRIKKTPPLFRPEVEAEEENEIPLTIMFWLAMIASSSIAIIILTMVFG